MYTMYHLIEPKTPLLEPCQTIIKKKPNHFCIFIIQPILNIHLPLPNTVLIYQCKVT